MFKPFYIHRHHQPGHLPSYIPRGFTLKISPVNDNHKKVTVQGTWCSPKDQFCKAEGRSFADQGEPKQINMRAVPLLLRTMTEKCYLGTEDFNYVLKYFI